MTRGITEDITTDGTADGTIHGTMEDIGDGTHGTATATLTTTDGTEDGTLIMDMVMDTVSVRDWMTEDIATIPYGTAHVKDRIQTGCMQAGHPSGEVPGYGAASAEDRTRKHRFQQTGGHQAGLRSTAGLPEERSQGLT